MSCHRSYHESPCPKCRKEKHYKWHHCESRPEPPCPPEPPVPPCPPMPPEPPCPVPPPILPPISGVGGWSPFTPPTSAQIDVLDKAVSGMIGATYTPLLVSTQLVNGTNYNFIAQKTVITGTQTCQTLVIIKVYETLDGEVTLSSITPIRC